MGYAVRGDRKFKMALDEFGSPDLTKLRLQVGEYLQATGGEHRRDSPSERPMAVMQHWSEVEQDGHEQEAEEDIEPMFEEKPGNSIWEDMRPARGGKRRV